VSGEFGRDSGQGDLTLEMKFPQNGASAMSDDISGSRLYGARRAVGIAAMKTSEVGIDITLNILKKLQVGLACCRATHDIKDSTHSVRHYTLEDSVLQ
jgi:hypothetical protein